MRRRFIPARPNVAKTKSRFALWQASGVYLRRCYRAKDGKRHAYWALVKSVRTARGLRQQVVAYLGEMDAAGRLGIEQLAGERSNAPQQAMFDAPTQRCWVEVDLSGVRVQNPRSFGGAWLALQIIHRLGLRKALEERYGQADRIWVMDRGMVSRANIEFLKQGNRRYIVGTPKSMLKRYEKQLMDQDWGLVREGLEVKVCHDPDGGARRSSCAARWIGRPRSRRCTSGLRSGSTRGW